MTGEHIVFPDPYIDAAPDETTGEIPVCAGDFDPLFRGPYPVMKTETVVKPVDEKPARTLEANLQDPISHLPI